MSWSVRCSSRSNRSFIAHNMARFPCSRKIPVSVVCANDHELASPTPFRFKPNQSEFFGFGDNSPSAALTLAAAVFVLLAAVARAGIIAADLGTDADGPGFFHGRRSFADDVTAMRSAFRARGLCRGIGARGGAAEGTSGLVQRPLRHVV